MAAIPDGIQVLRIGSTEVLSATTASTASATVSAEIVRVAVSSDNDVYLAIGSAATATTSDMLLTKGAIEYYRINSGVDIIAVETVTGTGIVTVTEAS